MREARKGAALWERRISWQELPEYDVKEFWIQSKTSEDKPAKQ